MTREQMAQQLSEQFNTTITPPIVRRFEESGLEDVEEVRMISEFFGDLLAYVSIGQTIEYPSDLRYSRLQIIARPTLTVPTVIVGDPLEH